MSRFDPIQYDGLSGAPVVIDFVHHEVHEGDHFLVHYSVASIGALTGDIMTVSFTTPADDYMHFVFNASSAAGGLLKLIEGKTGGGATPTGTLQSYNSNRNSATVSGITDVAGANATKASYGATAFTGGIELISDYIGAAGLGNTFSGGESRGEQEIVLKLATAYQISIYNTASVPGTIQLSWYE